MIASESRVGWRAWQPAIVNAIAGYSSRAALADVIAGVTVGVVALPLAMAFGMASGVTPQAGLYTAIVGGLIVALLGGSRIQIGGPTGAFVVIVSGIVAAHGVPGLLVVTMMAGVMLIFLALSGLGQAVKYIPRPVILGFTGGIAVIIASTQVKDLLGLAIADPPSAFLAKVAALAHGLPLWNPVALAMALVSIACIVVIPRWWPRLPGSIVALVVGTVWVVVLHPHVETIGSKFGGVPSGLPSPHVPALPVELFLPLLPSAVTVALLAAVESLLSAVVADSMIGARHNSNAELLAQGFANLVSPLCGGIPVTGAIARTATNFRSGGRTPVAGVVHALTLVVIVVVAAPLARFIPLATLAAILMVVAYNMSEWREAVAVWRLDWTDRSVWAITFALTVVADLTVAVEVGVALAALLYIRRITDTTSVSAVTPEYIESGRPHTLQDKRVPPYVTILRIHGPFLFGTGDKLAAETADLSRLAPIVVLRLRNMTAIDSTGVYALEQLAERLRASGRTLILCGAREQPKQILEQAEVLVHIGIDNFVPHIEAALSRAEEIQARFSGIGEEVARDLATAAL
jgi:SulP family sulfate permease